MPQTNSTMFKLSCVHTLGKFLMNLILNHVVWTPESKFLNCNKLHSHYMKCKASLLAILLQFLPCHTILNQSISILYIHLNVVCPSHYVFDLTDDYSRLILLITLQPWQLSHHNVFCDMINLSKYSSNGNIKLVSHTLQMQTNLNTS